VSSVSERHVPVAFQVEGKTMNVGNISEEPVAIFSRLWSIRDLATYLAVPSSWIYDRTQKNTNDRIPNYKIGKYLRFDPQSEEFQSWLKRNFRMAA
jgi:hypothetical protein